MILSQYVHTHIKSSCCTPETNTPFSSDNPAYCVEKDEITVPLPHRSFSWQGEPRCASQETGLHTGSAGASSTGRPGATRMQDWRNHGTENRGQGEQRPTKHTRETEPLRAGRLGGEERSQARLTETVWAVAPIWKKLGLRIGRRNLSSNSLPVRFLGTTHVTPSFSFV